MATPLDVLTLDDLSFVLGARVEPLVAAETAIARNIRRLYGVEVNLKTRRSLCRACLGQDRSRRRRRPPPARPPRTTSARAFPAPAPSERPTGTRRVPQPESATRTGSGYVGGALAAPGAPARARGQPGRCNASSRSGRPPRTTGRRRNALSARLLWLRHVLPGSRRPRAVWRGFHPGIQEAAIETIAFPISMPSCFQLAHDRRTCFRGLAPAEGGRLQRQIWKYLHCREPSEVVVVPVLVKTRVLNLVYAHAVDGGPLPGGPVIDLQALCAAVSSTYVRMIQKLKAGEPATSALGR